MFLSGQAKILSCVQGFCPCEVLLLQWGFVKGSKHGVPNVAAIGRNKSLVKACEKIKAEIHMHLQESQLPPDEGYLGAVICRLYQSVSGLPVSRVSTSTLLILFQVTIKRM